MKSNSPRTRLDLLLVERGLAEPQQKAGTRVKKDSQLEVKSRQLKYASRGGLKLEGALEDFQINPAGLDCLDVGSSTGGFTDCLLQRGAARVYSVDVNISQLAWK